MKNNVVAVTAAIALLAFAAFFAYVIIVTYPIIHIIWVVVLLALDLWVAYCAGLILKAIIDDIERKKQEKKDWEDKLKVLSKK